MAKLRYNGVRLPAFPEELNQKLYPCAFITRDRQAGEFNLICTSSRVYCSEGVTPVTVGWSASANRGRGFRCFDRDEVWSIDEDLDRDMTTGGFLTFGADKYDFIWTNTTIESSVGTVHLEASEPVPTFDLKSWLTGFAMGMAGQPLPADGRKGEARDE